MKFYYYSETEIGIFSRLRNRSKLNERSLLVVIHMLLGVWGDNFHNFFILFYQIWFC